MAQYINIKNVDNSEIQKAKRRGIDIQKIEIGETFDSEELEESISWSEFKKNVEGILKNVTDIDSVTISIRSQYFDYDEDYYGNVGFFIDYMRPETDTEAVRRAIIEFDNKKRKKKSLLKTKKEKIEKEQKDRELYEELKAKYENSEVRNSCNS